MTDPLKEYPDAPRAGVGAVILDGDRVLLVRRGRPPSEGKWSIPGGLIHLGERIEDAVMREVEEECGLRVRVIGLCGVLDRVVPGRTPLPDGTPQIRYHFVILDYVATVESGTLQAGSDAADARWVRIDELGQYDTTYGLEAMIQRAVKLSHGGLIV